MTWRVGRQLNHQVSVGASQNPHVGSIQLSSVVFDPSADHRFYDASSSDSGAWVEHDAHSTNAGTEDHGCGYGRKPQDCHYVWPPTIWEGCETPDAQGPRLRPPSFPNWGDADDSGFFARSWGINRWQWLWRGMHRGGDVWFNHNATDSWRKSYEARSHSSQHNVLCLERFTYEGVFEERKC